MHAGPAVHAMRPPTTHTIPLRQPHFFILAIFAFFTVFRLVLKNWFIEAIAFGVDWQSAQAACFCIDMPRCIVLGFQAMSKARRRPARVDPANPT
jgi:hypothetical protein